MINALHASLGPEAGTEIIVAALGEIHARIAAHFTLEERAMQQLHYAALAEHKADHERLLDDILDIMESVETPADYGRATSGRRLDDWFTVHFRTHDARLHSWLASRG